MTTIESEGNIYIKQESGNFFYSKSPTEPRVYIPVSVYPVKFKNNTGLVKKPL
jgi:hypothetical protein